jgi:hypothetical protein
MFCCDLFCGFLWVLSILCKYVGMFLICHCIFRRDAWRGLDFWSPVGIVGQKSFNRKLVNRGTEDAWEEPCDLCCSCSDWRGELAFSCFGDVSRTQFFWLSELSRHQRPSSELLPWVSRPWGWRDGFRLVVSQIFKASLLWDDESTYILSGWHTIQRSWDLTTASAELETMSRRAGLSQWRRLGIRKLTAYQSPTGGPGNRWINHLMGRGSLCGFVCK